MAFVTEAKNAIAIDGVTGEILFEHHAFEPVPPSSMSKLMTLYIVFNKLKEGKIKEDDLVSVSKEAWSRGGSSMFLKEKQKVSVKDLLKGIAIVSGNDASIAIAEFIRVTQAEFAEEMNNYAERLGLSNSHFVNSTGWPEEGHYMSAYDIAVLSRRIFYDFKDYYGIFSQMSLESNGIKQDNTNLLLSKSDEDVKIDGLKTGYSSAVGYGLVVSAENSSGNRIFVVVNGLENSKKRFFEAKRIVNYIFDNFEFKTLYKKGETIENVKVYYGKENMVPVVTKEDVFVVHKKLNKTSEIKLKFDYLESIDAPIKKGEKLGKLIVSIDEMKEEQGMFSKEKNFDLYANKDVEVLPAFKKFIYKIFAISNTKK